MKTLQSILIALLIFATLTTTVRSASNNTAQDPLNCPEKALTFNEDIKQIFNKHCTRCHNKNEREGFNFHKVEFVKKAAQSGKLLGSIKHIQGYQPMPRHLPSLKMASKLDKKNIDKIECWINSGMKE